MSAISYFEYSLQGFGKLVYDIVGCLCVSLQRAMQGNKSMCTYI